MVLDWLGYQLVMWLPYWIACDAKSQFGRWCLVRAGRWAYRNQTTALTRNIEKDSQMPGEISRSYSGPKDGRVPTWMDEQQSAMNFLSWLIEDTSQVHAEVNTPRDAQLQQYVCEGHLTFSFCAHDTNTYAITDKWLRSVR